MCRLDRLNNIKLGGQDKIEIVNSPLNEAGVLGFEYGFSLGLAGQGLVAWEAQFGDFANNAQAIIDLFVAAGQSFTSLPGGKTFFGASVFHLAVGEWSILEMPDLRPST